jgi:cell wall-associated NlpC family hydrolase
VKRIFFLAISAVAGLPIALAAVISPPSGSGNASPTTAATAEIPAALLPVYESAALTCPGLPWPVLAAIGYVESRHAGGHADPSTGHVEPPIVGPPLDGSNGTARIPDPSSADGWAHALGPMQFLSTTWETWAVLAPDRPPDASPNPQNAWDAIFSAARYLCAGQSQLDDIHAAVLRYNHSESYWAEVHSKAIEYGLGSPGTSGTTIGGSGEAVVAAALSQLGVPYVWGGASPAVGFDCSGLVQWAYAQIGVALGRTTFDQLDDGVSVSVGDLHAGDLVFSQGTENGRQVDFGHVAIYAGGGYVVVAPHTGAVVSLQLLDVRTVEAVRRIVS